MIIDPMTALAGIQSAISMVKKASKVANDLGSLAPMIGKMFDAKSVATKDNKASNTSCYKQCKQPVFHYCGGFIMVLNKPRL